MLTFILVVVVIILTALLLQSTRTHQSAIVQRDAQWEIYVQQRDAQWQQSFDALDYRGAVLDTLEAYAFIANRLRQRPDCQQTEKRIRLGYQQQGVFMPVFIITKRGIRPLIEMPTTAQQAEPEPVEP